MNFKLNLTTFSKVIKTKLTFALIQKPYLCIEQKQTIMEDSEFYKKALQLQCYLANRMAEVRVYGEHWGANFCYKEMKEAMDKYCTDNYVKEVFNIENLTRERAKALRFKMFDKGQMPNLYLFPIWFVLLLPYGTKVVSIGGEEFEYNEDTDLDTRFGCVAFGINIYK